MDNPQQDFWERLQKKIVDKNQTLQKRENELKCRLDALNSVAGDGRRDGPMMKTCAPECFHVSEAYMTKQASPTQLGYPEVVVPQYNVAVPQYNLSPVQPQYGPPEPQNAADIKSCVCPPSEEKTSFFKNVLSMFPSFNCKHAASAQSAPPIPDNTSIRKEVQENVINQTVYSAVYKNENCLCSPCPGDANPPPQKEESICSCSICEKPRNNIEHESTCSCSICSRNDDNACCCTATSKDYVPKKATNNNGQDKPIKPDNDICSCSICSKISNKEGLCCCNYELITDGEILLPTSAARQKESNFPISASKLSLKSADLFYMKNIHDLASQQKAILSNINEMEKRTRIYEEVFNEYRGVELPGQRMYANAEPAKTAEDKLTSELKVENLLLKNELRDMRLEVRQYIEKMEGPMIYKIESEKYKNAQLEQRLEQAAQELISVQELFQKEMNTLKLQLCTANTNVYNLTASNQKLGEELQAMKAKCTQLNEDLIRQKISEAETLKALQALKAQAGAAREAKEECSLHQIARELSKTLRECEPCGECMRLPEDLTAAARLLKSLTDMIDQKIPKEDTKPLEPTEQESEVVKDTDSVKPQETGEPLLEGMAEKPVSERDSLCICPDTVEECLQEPKAQRGTKESIIASQGDAAKSEKSARASLASKQSEAVKSERSAKGSVERKQSEAAKSERSARASLGSKQAEAVKSERTSKVSLGSKQGEAVKSERSGRESVASSKQSEAIKSEKSARASLEARQSATLKSDKSPRQSVEVQQTSEKSAKESLQTEQIEEEKASVNIDEAVAETAKGSLGERQSVAAKSEKSASETVKSEKSPRQSLQAEKIEEDKVSVATKVSDTEKCVRKESVKSEKGARASVSSKQISEAAKSEKSAKGSLQPEQIEEEPPQAGTEAEPTEAAKSEKSPRASLAASVASKKASVATIQEEPESRKKVCTCGASGKPAEDSVSEQTSVATAQEGSTIPKDTCKCSDAEKAAPPPQGDTVCICPKCSKLIEGVEDAKPETPKEQASEKGSVQAPEGTVREERGSTASQLKKQICKCIDGREAESTRKPSQGDAGSGRIQPPAKICICPKCYKPMEAPEGTIRQERGSTASQPKKQICKCIDGREAESTRKPSQGDAGSGRIQPPAKICICPKCHKPTEGVEESKAPEGTVREERGSTASQPKKQICKCLEGREAESTMKPCTCLKKQSEIKEFVPAAYVAPRAEKPCRCSETNIAPEGTGDQPGEKGTQEIVKAQPSGPGFKVEDNFPFNVDTRIDILEKCPDGVHVTTTITNSGMLEVVTEGPEGFIETTLIYTQSGNVEVVTEVLEYEAKDNRKCTRGTMKASAAGAKAIEPCRPETCQKALSGAKASETRRISGAQETNILQTVGSPTPSSQIRKGLNPNCQCIRCVALEAEDEEEERATLLSKQSSIECDKAASETGKSSAKDQPAEIIEERESAMATFASKVTLPEDCRCSPCPHTELGEITEVREIPEVTEPRKDSEISLNAKKSSMSDSESHLKLPDDCRCLSCPQTELHVASGANADGADATDESSPQTEEKRSSTASQSPSDSKSKCGACRCSSCK